MGWGTGKGGIGDTGRGWSGSGNESRSTAGHAGANVGRSSGGSDRGGGGYGGRGSSSTRGLDSPAGQNRRARAVDAFTGRVQSGMRSLAGSLGFGSPTMNSNADPLGKTQQSFNRQIDEALGINSVVDVNTGHPQTTHAGNPDNLTQFNSISPYASPRKLEKREQEIGSRQAVRAEAIGGIPKAGGLLKAGANLMSGYLSDAGQQAYGYTQEAALGDVGNFAAQYGTQGVLTGLLKSPIANPVSTMLVGAMNTKLAADYAKTNYGVEFSQPQQRRRSEALRAFGGGRSSLIGSTATTPTHQPYSVWEPAKYGVGNYGSHIKGLLSS